MIHIQRLEKVGFTPGRAPFRCVSYGFTQSLAVTLNKEEYMAGYELLNSVLDRNKELKIRHTCVIAICRAEGRNRKRQ